MGTPAPLLVTMGEPAGIGGEILLKTWAARHQNGLPRFVALDRPNRLRAIAAALDLPVPIAAVDTVADGAALFDQALPVLPLSQGPDTATFGQPDSRYAGAVIEAIERAVALTRSGAAAGLVTNPIHKAVVQAAGFPHPGHTEFLEALAGPGYRAVMMLACPQLRVVPLTIHIPLAAVPGKITADLLIDSARIVAGDLTRRFGIAHPRLAFAGLNPHAGEAGQFGREEIEVIAPALDRLRAEGLSVLGPLSADTLFHAEARARYDVALCMYHDQALIPIKTLDFAGGVNVTLGLPFIRTSPDHGTAFDIAGRGCADPTSLIAAIRMAGDMKDSQP